MFIERIIVRKKYTYYNGTKGETENMKSNKALSVIGATATLIGFLASLLTGWVGVKKQENTIAKEVEKAVNKRFEN